jgi:hypothetical protein
MTDRYGGKRETEGTSLMTFSSGGNENRGGGENFGGGSGGQGLVRGSSDEAKGGT